MKGILKFNLDDRSDRMAHVRATKALDAYLCLLALRNKLEGISSGNIEGETGDELCEFFDNMLEKYGIRLEEELE